MSQLFDPQAYLDATIEAPSERRNPLEVGVYTAIIGEVKARAWQGRKDPTKSGIAWDVPLQLEIPPEVAQRVGYDKLTLTDSIMLDLTEQGTIDNSPGRNGRMRTYREALDMNKPGDSFSARKMQGQAVLVQVNQEPYTAPSGDTMLVERVGAITRMK